jgi:large repetitive protein
LSAIIFLFHPFPQQELSNSDGSYIFKGLPASKTYSVIATTNTLTSDIEYLGLEEGEHFDSLDLYCYPALSLSGVAYFKGTDDLAEGVQFVPAGQEIPDKRARDFKGKLPKAVSDKEGKILFTGLAAGEYGLFTSEQGPYKLAGTSRWKEEPVPVSLLKDEVHDTVVVEVLGGRVIVGTVTNEAGNPISRVNIWTVDFAPQMINCNSGADGKYRLVGIPFERRNKLSVVFKHRDYVTTEQKVEFLENEWEVECSVVLGKGPGISGMVTNSDSEPIEDVHVVGSSFSKGGAGIGRGCRTDTEGRYTLRNLAPGSWNIKLEKEGYGSVKTTGFVIETEDLENVNLVMDKACTISGKILLGDGKPLQHMSVLFIMESPSYYWGHQAKTDADGTFVIKGLKKGVYNIIFEIRHAPGSVLSRDVRKVVSNVATGTTDLVFQLGGFGSISGHVQDEASSEPVMEFSVNVYGWDEDKHIYPVFMKIVTTSFSAEDGSFIIEELPANKYRLEINAEGYAIKNVYDIEVEEGITTEEIVISLDGGGKVIGRVIEGAGGKPLPDVELTLNAYDFTHFGTKIIATDEEGRFVFESVSPGVYRILSQYENFAAKLIMDIEVSAGKSTDVGDIVFSSGATVEGRVTDNDGKGISDVDVFCMGNGSYQDGKTDEEGYYSMSNVFPGETRVMCMHRFDISSHSGWSKSFARKVVLEQGDTVTVDIMFEEGCKVSGHVADNGKYVAGSSVNLLSTDDKSAGISYLVKSDESGNFLIEGVVPGKYLLVITQDDKSSYQCKSYQYRQMVNVGQDDLTLDVNTNNTLVMGKLINKGEKPLFDRGVRFKPLDGSEKASQAFPQIYFRQKYLEAVTNHLGEFSMGKIPPGRYTVGITNHFSQTGFKPLKEITVDSNIEIKDLLLEFKGE